MSQRGEKASRVLWITTLSGALGMALLNSYGQKNYKMSLTYFDGYRRIFKVALIFLTKVEYVADFEHVFYQNKVFVFIQNEAKTIQRCCQKCFICSQNLRKTSTIIAIKQKHFKFGMFDCLQ